MLGFAIFAVTFVVALVLAILYLYPSSKKTTTIPGLEPSSEEDGNQSDIKNAGSLHEFLLDLHKRFGPITSFWLGRQFVVSIASPELFKEQQSLFDRPPSLFKLFEPMVTEHCIQYANKGDGRNRRKVYDAAYSSAALTTYYPCIQKVTNELIAKWNTMLNADHIPLTEYMMALAIKSIIMVNFGANTLDDKTILELRHCYDMLWSDMETSLTEGHPVPGSDRQKRFDKELKKFLGIIHSVIEYRKAHYGEGDSSDIFMDILVNSGFENDVIVADAVTYMVGGFHTTGNVLTWAMYFLASHPEIQERAAEEVKVQVNDEEIDHENIDSLVFVRNIVHETLRCAVVAPYAARFQDSDSQLGGHFIPKNTPVIQALGVLLQDENYWPNPHKFDPDRFSAENSQSRPSLVFQPFGFAGKRKCPGYRLAYSESITMLAMILRKFRILLVEGQVVTPVFGLVCHPSEEIWIQLEKR